MEYRYNQERDRLLSRAYNPSFFKAVYVGQHAEREVMLWACTSNTRHQQTVAESFAKTDETVEDIKLISKATFEKWLLGGKDSVEVNGTAIPADYVVRFFIAEDHPNGERLTHKGRYGNLEGYRTALLNKEEIVLKKLFTSYMASRPEADVVRIAPEPPKDHPGLATYKEESAQKDAEEKARRSASMKRPNVEPLKEPGCGCGMNDYDEFDEEM